MMAKLSTRRYAAGLEPVGASVEAQARSTSHSAVSRRFVARTETALAELMAADLSGLDIVALMVDGVHFAGHCCVVALGIGADGTKVPLGVVEGDTENATVVKDLLVGLRDRGLDIDTPSPCRDRRRQGVGLGGEGGLRSPGDPALPAPQDPQRRGQAVQGHGLDGGEEGSAPPTTTPIRCSAEAALEQLARSLDKAHPGAAGWLREGLADTLTVSRLGVPPTLARTLRSTNAIESMIEICRDHSQREAVAGRPDGAALVRSRHG